MEAHRSIPEDLLDAYTSKGEIPVFNYFFINCSSNNKPDWSDAYLKSFTDRFTFENIIYYKGNNTENYSFNQQMNVFTNIFKNKEITQTVYTKKFIR